MNDEECALWHPFGFYLPADFVDFVQRKDAIVAFRYYLIAGVMVVVIKQMYNYKLAISKHDLHFYDDTWCYQYLVDAIIALFLWNPLEMEEPLGWIRNPQTGRRREYDETGRITREWVQW